MKRNESQLHQKVEVKTKATCIHHGTTNLLPCTKPPPTRNSQSSPCMTFFPFTTRRHAAATTCLSHALTMNGGIHANLISRLMKRRDVLHFTEVGRGTDRFRELHGWMAALRS